MISVASALITNDAGQVFMARRPANKMCPGMWDYPGGKVEDNETPTEALERELREELGVRCSWAYGSSRIVYHDVLEFREPLYFRLYEMRIVGEPAPLEGQLGLGFFDLEHAVSSMPCCPSTYLSYRAVRKHLDRRAKEKR